MCTSIDLNSKYHYFGRNLDLEYSYDEAVTTTPKNFRFRFRKAGSLMHHYAMLGMAYVKDGYPLYYDAINEKGLCMAGLNFPGNAYYLPPQIGKINIAPFEFIPYILSVCASLDEAKSILKRVNICDISFSHELLNTPLHWHVSDKSGCICVEPGRYGLKIYNNPVGVLTNNPRFDMQLFNLNNYLNITSAEAENRFSDNLKLEKYSRGMGALGIPGDWSSQSRFVRATFLKFNSVCGDSERESVSRFFHILDAVSVVKGSVYVGNKPEFTLYSSCCNADKGIYYYKTYNSLSLKAIKMHDANLDADKLVIQKINL